MQNLTYKFFILQNIVERSGITKTQISNLSDERLMDLIGKKHFPIKMLDKKSRYFIYLVILYRMKQ